MPVQQRLLLIFVRHPQQILSRQFLQQQLWPSPPQSTSASAKALSLAVHRLRQTFAGGPLGTEVVKAVYGKGYRLDCPVEAVPPPESAPRPSCVERLPAAPASPLDGGANLAQLYYSEVHDYWPGRDPYDLEHRLWLLRQCLANDPTVGEACFEFCYFSLLQCLWGLRSSASVLPEIQNCLTSIDLRPNLSSSWSAIRAEVMTMLLWQPRLSVRRYGQWLTASLPCGLPLYSWSRHLIFSGNPQLAVQTLRPAVHQDLRQGWMALSLAHAASGNLDAAIQAAHQQLRIDATLVGSRLFLAMLVALRGNGEFALRLVASTGVLERPFQGSLALVCYALAHGSLRHKAHLLLDEALAVIRLNPDNAGGIGYWGLAALALERSVDALYLLPLSVRQRCYSAPVVLAMPFLEPFSREPACFCFRAEMQAAFQISSTVG